MQRISERYSTPAIVLHWLIAALMIVNVVLGLCFSSIPQGSLRPYIETHKSIGITVLGLGIVRLLWRLTHTPPAMPPYRPWERVAAHAVHWGLYGLVFALPLSGWLHDSAWKLAPTHPLKLFFVIPWFRFGFLQNMDPVTQDYWHKLLGQVHVSFGYVLYAMVAVHVGGALKHQILEGYPELQRMWPARRG